MISFILTIAFAIKPSKPKLAGKTAIQDMVVHMDPDFAKHRAGREVMQKLEDSFKEASGEGPGVEVGRRLPMWPLKCAAWSRIVHRPGDSGQFGAPPELQPVNYILVYFTVYPSLPLPFPLPVSCRRAALTLKFENACLPLAGSATRCRNL